MLRSKLSTTHYPPETQDLRRAFNRSLASLAAEKNVERLQVRKEDGCAGLHTLCRRPPRRLWVRLPDTHQIGMIASGTNLKLGRLGLGCDSCCFHESDLPHVLILCLEISLASVRDECVMKGGAHRDETKKDRYGMSRYVTAMWHDIIRSAIG